MEHNPPPRPPAGTPEGKSRLRFAHRENSKWAARQPLDGCASPVGVAARRVRWGWPWTGHPRSLADGFGPRTPIAPTGISQASRASKSDCYGHKPVLLLRFLDFRFTGLNRRTDGFIIGAQASGDARAPRLVVYVARSTARTLSARKLHTPWPRGQKAERKGTFFGTPQMPRITPPSVRAATAYNRAYAAKPTFTPMRDQIEQKRNRYFCGSRDAMRLAGVYPHHRLFERPRHHVPFRRGGDAGRLGHHARCRKAHPQ